MWVQEGKVNSRSSACDGMIMEKCDEHSIDLHMLFIYFIQAFDRMVRCNLVEGMRNIEVVEDMKKIEVPGS